MLNVINDDFVVNNGDDGPFGDDDGLFGDGDGLFSDDDGLFGDDTVDGVTFNETNVNLLLFVLL